MATEEIKFEPPAQSRDEDILYTTLQRQPYEKESESRIEDLLIQLNESIISGGGGGGFTPTDTQLAAMNSGIDSTKVQQISTNETNISSLDGKTKAMSAGDDDYIVINGVRLYVGATEPTGTIPEGSLWLNSAVINP